MSSLHLDTNNFFSSLHWQLFAVPSAPLQALPRARGVHQSCESCSCTLAVTGYDIIAVPERLADWCAVACSGGPGQLQPPCTCTPARRWGQSREVTAGTFLEGGFYWGGLGQCSCEGLAIPSQGDCCASSPHAPRGADCCCASLSSNF